jgi:hypothetical protein
MTQHSGWLLTVPGKKKYNFMATDYTQNCGDDWASLLRAAILTAGGTIPQVGDDIPSLLRGLIYSIVSLGGKAVVASGSPVGVQPLVEGNFYINKDDTTLWVVVNGTWKKLV